MGSGIGEEVSFFATRSQVDCVAQASCGFHTPKRQQPANQQPPERPAASHPVQPWFGTWPAKTPVVSVARLCGGSPCADARNSRELIKLAGVEVGRCPACREGSSDGAGNGTPSREAVCGLAVRGASFCPEHEPCLHCEPREKGGPLLQAS